MIKELGKYSILEEIGRGSMGMVYKAKDKNIGRIAAIKTIKLPDVTPKEKQELTIRFKQEAMAAGNLNHPNIVTIYEYDHDDDIAFIAMEFIKGVELKSLLDENEAFTEQHIISIMKQLLAALQYSHQHGVIHRDIKPSNLMITNNEFVKVTDFGIARLESSELTQVGATIGTPSYMSPEQCIGQVVDARSDIFSAGVLLYQLLTGEKPFAGPSITSILHKITQISPPDPSQLNFSISSKFDEIIKRSLAKRPTDRYQSAKEFSEDLQKVLPNTQTEIVRKQSVSNVEKAQINSSVHDKPNKIVDCAVIEDETIAVPLDSIESSLDLSSSDQAVLATDSKTNEVDDETIAVPAADVESFLNGSFSDRTTLVDGANELTIEDATIAVPAEDVESYLDDSFSDRTTVVADVNNLAVEDETIAVPVEGIKQYLDYSATDQTVVVSDVSKLKLENESSIMPSEKVGEFEKQATWLQRFITNKLTIACVVIFILASIGFIMQKSLVTKKSPPIESLTTGVTTEVDEEIVVKAPHPTPPAPEPVEKKSQAPKEQVAVNKQAYIEEQIYKPTSSSIQPGLYSYSIISSPPGATIEHRILGTLDAITPMEVFLKKGLHQIYITKTGYQDMAVMIDLNESNEKTLNIELIQNQ